MEEDKKEPEEKQEETEEKEEGNELLEKAEAVAKRLETANKEKEELLRVEQQLRASGVTEAGTQKPEAKPETPEEYADKVRRGEANPLRDDGII